MEIYNHARIIFLILEKMGTKRTKFSMMEMNGNCECKEQRTFLQWCPMYFELG